MSRPFLTRRSLLACLVAGALPPAALAQRESPAAWPQRPIRLVAGFPAGGSADAQARLLASSLAERLHQQVIVDNRPGAAGSLSADIVAKAPADGYTVLLAASSIFAINPWLYKNLPFDVQRDLTLVAQVASFQSVVVVPAASAFKSLREVMADAQAHPARWSYGSPGAGTAANLSAELLRSTTGVQIVHVPYKGDAPLLSDLLGAQLPLGFVNMQPALPLIAAGKLRVLAVTGAKRSPNLPQVPTMQELGYAGTAVTGWSGLAVRSGTAPAVVEKLSSALRELLAEPQLREKLIAQAAEPHYADSAEFTRFAAAERQRFGVVIRQSGISGD